MIDYFSGACDFLSVWQLVVEYGKHDHDALSFHKAEGLQQKKQKFIRFSGPCTKERKTWC